MTYLILAGCLILYSIFTIVITGIITNLMGSAFKDAHINLFLLLCFSVIIWLVMVVLDLIFSFSFQTMILSPLPIYIIIVILGVVPIFGKK